MIKPYKACYLLLLALLCCRKPYSQPAITSPGNYLIVEGVINTGSDSTTITLSRTVNISNATTANPVLNAIVAVESDQNIVYPLTGIGNGIYVSTGLNLDNSHAYRLSIKTANNEQYYSDYVAALNSPPIDSVYYIIANNELSFYCNTHDPTNTVKYYRWEFQETWIFNSNFDSHYYSNGDTVLARPANDQIYTCWGNVTSSNIILASTANLSKDVVDNNLMISIPSTSEKLNSKYSIIVRQYALTGDAYNF